MPRFFRIALLLILVLAVAGVHLEGHAILKSSSPSNGGFVTSPDSPVTLTFNVRVDAARSKAYAAKPDASFGQQIRTYRLCGNEQVATDHRTGVQMPTHRALGKGEIDQFITGQMRA